MRLSSKVLILVLVAACIMLSGCYSCRTWHQMWGTGPVAPEVADKLYWDKDCKPLTPKTTVVRQKAAPATDCGPYTASWDYPCGACGIVRMEKTMPRQVQADVPFDYQIKVTNLTKMMISDIVVRDKLPSNLQFDSATPVPQKDDGDLVWKFDSLEPGSNITMNVTGTPSGTDCVTNCATITYLVPVCASSQIVEPKLKLTKTAPSEVLLCDPIPVKLVVANAGTGAAPNVSIVDRLPEGLETADGKSRLAFDAGTLGPGQSREFSAVLRATKAGKYVNKATTSSSSGLKAQATTTTVVRKPVLAITKTGRKTQYIGRTLTYEITVTNKGDGPARKTVVEDSIPAGVTSVKPSSGGRIVGSKVIWELGTLAANSSKKVSVTCTPTRIATLRNTATAKAYCADVVSASATTSVAGIPAVLLEVIDLVDPVEVGNQTTYVITATNQGSMPGTNITIICTWEDKQQYVSSSGATTGRVEANTLKVAPLRSLAPQARATWRVVIRAVQPGDVRFAVRMNTGEFERPVEETESTNLYR